MKTDRIVEILEEKNACSECACNMSDSIRPKGKWLIPYGSYSYWRTIYRCSLCGYETENNSNYCPNCGDYKRG